MINKQHNLHHAVSLLALAALALVALCVGGCGQFVDAEDYDPNTPGDGEALVVRSDVKAIKHSAFAEIMSRFSAKTADGAYVVFDYDALADDIDAQYIFDGYLRLLASVDPSGLEGRGQKLAYWINGYNASVIKSVLDSYGGDHSFRTNSSTSFFSTPSHVFAGIKLSLNQVEHGAGRKDFDARAADFVGMTSEDQQKLRAWADELWGSDLPYSRLHAAFNCGALSCPNLPGMAPFVFDPTDIEAQLDRYTTAWVDNADKGAGPDGISQIFTWYKSDFERTHGSAKDFVTAFRSGGVSDVAFDKSLDYDWTLNSTDNMPSAQSQR